MRYDISRCTTGHRIDRLVGLPACSGNPILFPGAHVSTTRDGYRHHGIYVGGGKVVHYSGFCEKWLSGQVEAVSVGEFASGQDLQIEFQALPAFSPMETVERACSRLGEHQYNLITNNCEHFCTWCIYGQSRSSQVENCLRDPRAALRTGIGLIKALARTWLIPRPAETGEMTRRSAV
ncbi:lecithin retinol acyltransferase family protein [Cupriavidus sp. 2TAF22]|uniref:lecithin retinol acyltransferase family protein n=1 Tax=unclassified Cupriavidus TaxID=2640874 RepID=UPI003F92BB09